MYCEPSRSSTPRRSAVRIANLNASWMFLPVRRKPRWRAAAVMASSRVHHVLPIAAIRAATGSRTSNSQTLCCFVLVNLKKGEFKAASRRLHPEPAASQRGLFMVARPRPRRRSWQRWVDDFASGLRVGGFVRTVELGIGVQPNDDAAAFLGGQLDAGMSFAQKLRPFRSTGGELAGNGPCCKWARATAAPTSRFLAQRFRIGKQNRPAVEGHSGTQHGSGVPADAQPDARSGRG